MCDLGSTSEFKVFKVESEEKSTKKASLCYKGVIGTYRMSIMVTDFQKIPKFK